MASFRNMVTYLHYFIQWNKWFIPFIDFQWVWIRLPLLVLLLLLLLVAVAGLVACYWYCWPPWSSPFLVALLLLRLPRLLLLLLLVLLLRVAGLALATGTATAVVREQNWNFWSNPREGTSRSLGLFFQILTGGQNHSTSSFLETLIFQILTGGQNHRRCNYEKCSKIKIFVKSKGRDLQGPRDPIFSDFDRRRKSSSV